MKEGEERREIDKEGRKMKGQNWMKGGKKERDTEEGREKKEVEWDEGSEGRRRKRMQGEEERKGRR